MKIKFRRNGIIFLLLMILFLSGTIFYTKQGVRLQPIMLAVAIIMIIITAFFNGIRFQVDLSLIHI